MPQIDGSEKPAKAGSPALGKRFLGEKAAEGAATFSAEGAVHKTGFLTLLLVLGGAWAWSNPAVVGPFMLPLAILSFVLAMVVIFVPTTAAFTAPLYAVLEGALLGTVSVAFEQAYHGIVFQAALGTMTVLAIMVLGYAVGIFRFGQRMKAVIVAATMGLALVYVADMVLGFFGHQVGLINSSGPYGIAFTVVALVVAALNFSLDFDFIERAEREGLAKRMEWYAGFAVLLTLVWVYVEMLRLLSKLRKR